jgi:two-component system, chemotaxis family, chemotaxis protein CheY
MNNTSRKPRAMVVDDSSVVRRVGERILRKLGFSVSCHVDGQDALEHCRKEMPDLILLDWHMPRMDGMDFLARLKSEGGAPLPRIAFCTTENHPEQISAAMSAGADEYIMKPFDDTIIRLKLEQIGFELPR